MSEEWNVGEESRSDVKKVVFPDGSSLEVPEFTPEKIKAATASKGYKRFSVAEDEDGETTLGPTDSLSDFDTLYIIPKEKVA